MPTSWTAKTFPNQVYMRHLLYSKNKYKYILFKPKTIELRDILQNLMWANKRTAGVQKDQHQLLSACKAS